MRLHDIENWALNVIDQVNAKQPNEDSRVELKTDWPDPYKAARRIAGHANASRGEPILWLIGVDEKTGVKGASLIDLASWFAQVESKFDELAPSLTPVNVPTSGTTVVALLFETERAPFVVKTEGTDKLEVPWRGSTSIRSARREELLRVLSPLQKLPSIEVVACSLSASSGKSQGGQEYIRWRAKLALFLTQPSNQELVIPKHRCSLSYIIPDYETWESFRNIDFYAVGANNIHATENFLSIRGSGVFEVRDNISGQLEKAEEKFQDDKLFALDVRLKLLLLPAEAERSIRVSVELPYIGKNSTQGRLWRKGWYEFLLHPKR